MNEFETKFIEMYKECGNSMGTGDLLTEIFARVYIEPDAIAMDELVKQTGYSLASISNTVKMLNSVGMIKKSRKPGTKKIFLSADKDIINMMKNHMIKKEEYMLVAIKDKLPEIIKIGKERAKTEKDKQKLKIIENYFEQIKKMETIIQKMKELFDSE